MQPARKLSDFKALTAAYDQCQSLFFQKLPAKIRHEIYNYYVLGGPPIHIRRERADRLGSCRCLKPTELPITDEKELRKYSQLCHHSDSPYYTYWRPTNPLHPSPSPLLSACQRIYSETAKILYSANTFTFHCPRDLVDFESRIPVTHLENIRSVHLNLCFDGGALPRGFRDRELGYWKQAITILSERLVSLSRLRVFLGHFVDEFHDCCVSLPEPSITPDAPIEAEIFKDLNSITPSKDFVVWANWHVRRDVLRDSSIRLIEIVWENAAALRTEDWYWHDIYADFAELPLTGWILFGDMRVDASCINTTRSMGPGMTL